MPTTGVPAKGVKCQTGSFADNMLFYFAIITVINQIVTEKFKPRATEGDKI